MAGHPPQVGVDPVVSYDVTNGGYQRDERLVDVFVHGNAKEPEGALECGGAQLVVVMATEEE